jgi:hypothetical protein
MRRGVVGCAHDGLNFAYLQFSVDADLHIRKF